MIIFINRIRDDLESCRSINRSNIEKAEAYLDLIESIEIEESDTVPDKELISTALQAITLTGILAK